MWLQSKLSVMFCLIVSSVFAADATNSFSNANLNDYLATHQGSMTIQNTAGAVKEAQQVIKSNPQINQPAPRTIVENRTVIVNNNQDNPNNYANDGLYGGYYYDYGGGYYGNQMGGYSGYSPARLHADEAHGREVLDRAHE